MPKPSNNFTEHTRAVENSLLYTSRYVYNGSFVLRTDGFRGTTALEFAQDQSDRGKEGRAASKRDEVARVDRHLMMLS